MAGFSERLRVPSRALFRVIAILAILTASAGSAVATAETCEHVVRALNQRLPSRIDEEELASALRSLNESGDGKLPSKFIRKGQARKRGWRPGRDLWSVPELRGKSIGGDRF